MNAKSIYDKLVNVEGVPSSILTYSDKDDCIIIEVQDYDKSVFKFAKEFFKGYKSTDIIYTNEDKTAVWYNDVSVYSDEETIRVITDFYYRAKVKGLVESKKSMKESINGDCYIYYDDDDNKRLVFCDYVKGITDTSDWFYLNEYIIDAIHIFKNEKQAQKFIDEHLKYFADQDKVVIAEYPQTVSGFFESKKSARKSIEESKEINLIDNVANKLRKITDAYVDTYRGADWISLGKDEYTIKIIYVRNELSIELYKDGDFKDGELEYASSLSDDDFSVNYIIDFIKNFIKNRNYLKNKISIKESKEFTRKSIKESADDNWYKLKMLNEMLDAMEEDEYNIPKLGIYGVTKNIDLDEGAIEALIKYYK